MTHGDAVMILKRPTATKSEKYEALEIVFGRGSMQDFNVLNKKVLWKTCEYLYKEVKKEK